MTDTNLLCKKLDESGYKRRFIAEKLDLTYQGFLNKLQNKSEFKVSEIQSLIALLELSEAERNAIFFSANVDNISTIRNEV